jgi:hypothetical protein
MVRLALCSLIVAAAVPIAAQTPNNYPAAGTEAMGVGSNSWGGSGSAVMPSMWRRDYVPGVAARPEQVRIGSPVYSTEGGLIGRVAYTDSRVAVVKSAHWALRLPVKTFGVQKDRLLLPLSPTSFTYLARRHGAPIS